MTNLFTPRHGQTRLRLNLSDDDMAKIGRGGPWSATVTDTNTGRVYDVKGAACDLPRCFCDAVVTRAYGLPVHDPRPGAIPIPAVFAPNGPGFRNLYSGDSVEFLVRLGGHGKNTMRTTRTARVLPLLVFPDHVQVNYGTCGYTVNASNFVRLVRRGKRHMAADKAAHCDHLPNARGSICMRCGSEV